MIASVCPEGHALARHPSAILPDNSNCSAVNRTRPSQHAHPATQNDVGPVFQLVSDRILPSFDTSKSLKTMLLSKHGVRKFNQIRSRWRVVITIMLHIGSILMLITVLAPRPIGHVTAIIAPILQFPGTAIIICAVRVQMLRILLGTYDFWFFTVTNIIFCISFWIVLGDVRVISMVFGCIILQISICSDAQVGNARQLLAASIINVVAQSLLFLAVVFRLVDVSPDRESQLTLIEYAFEDRGALTTRDMLVNMQFNIVVLFAKLVYRNWHIARGKKRVGRRISSNSMLVPQSRKCASYQCVVRLLRVEPERTIDPIPSIGSLDSDSASVSANSIAQLVFEPIGEVFDARNTVAPIKRWEYFQQLMFTSDEKLEHHRSILRAFLVVCGSVGFVSTVLADPLGFVPFRLPTELVQKTASICSVAFCLTFVALYQRELLSRLVWSFDFFFLSSNITAINCCLSSLLGWDHRIFVTWSFWLWMHWALTLDALTPSVAGALGFRRIYMVPVVMVMFLIQVVAVIDFFFVHKLMIPDRTLFSTTIGTRQVTVKFAPFLFARTWSVLLWSGRLLWRSFTRRCDEERLMLQGQVEFHFNWVQEVAPKKEPSTKLTSQISSHQRSQCTWLQSV